MNVIPFARRSRRHGIDSGYAMLTVIGFGTAVVLTVGAVGGYALQTMDSAGRSQGFNAAIQAAQAGVDDFVSKLNANSSYGTAPDTAWQPVAGSVDGDGASCAVPVASVPPNCPQFKHSAVATATGYTVTSIGKSRGVERTVQVTLEKRAFTDYLYFSDIEAADPQDGWAYPLGAPANCGKPAWGASTRPTSGCVIPTWRGGDSTDGSRVHTDDVFEVVSSPTFDSRVTAAIASCATTATDCVRKTYDAGADPDYNDGAPSYADDLDMPANGLAQIAANATTAAGGCTYYGPTRIHFEGAGKMRVWSPQTPAGPGGNPCGGGIDATVLNTPVNVVVTTLNQAGVCSLLLIGPLLCAVLKPLGSIVQLPLSQVLGSSMLLNTTGVLDTIAGLVQPGRLVDIPSSGAIYVQENALGNSPIPDPAPVQCLLGAALGMYSTADATITAGLLNSNGTIGSNCRAGKLFVDGELDGKVTVGIAGDIVIMSDLTYRSSDNADNDRLGLVATGPVEVYNPLQCVLALGTCMSLESLNSTLTGALPALISAGSGNLTDLLNLIPGYGDDITIDASIVSLGHRFGMQLPLLSLGVNLTLLNKLVNLNIDPPTLRLNGALAQKYRGIIAADLLNLGLTIGGNRLPTLNLVGANVDIGYDFEMVYDGKLRTDAPLYMPAPTNAIWDPQTFAELDA